VNSLERSYFFDSTDIDQRIYQAADWARFHAQIIGNGVSNDPSLPNLSVEPKTNMTVMLGAGYMFANGFMYENTSSLDLVHDVAEPTIDRIDRIVIAFDNNPLERRVYAYVKKGIPSENPVPPGLTRDGYVYEMSVAQVRILAGKSFIEITEITDERTNSAVCGYIPLHNIYRGLRISNSGIVSLLNQSFIKAVNTSRSLSWEEGQQQPLPYGTIVEDTQGEVISTSSFKCKSSGIYNLWAEVGFYESAFPIGLDVQIYVYVNGVHSFPMIAKVLNSFNDNYAIANGVDRFEEGDEVEIRCTMFNTGGTKPVPDKILQRIVKIS
jgi:hypothetical protein